MIGTSQDLLRFTNLLGQFGKRTLNGMYPNEFEFYACALELVDGSSGDSLDYFYFPVMPNSYRETFQPIKSINKTLNGIHVVKSNSFSPREISLNGDFGKNFKFVVNNNSLFGAAIGINLKSLTHIFHKDNIFSNTVKTGFGCLKYLENICVKAQEVNKDGVSNLLYFYNTSLGNHYLVEVKQFSPSQTREKSGIWDYSLNLTAIATLDSVIGSDKVKSSLKHLTQASLITKTASTLSSLAISEIHNIYYKNTNKNSTQLSKNLDKREYVKMEQGTGLDKNQYKIFSL